MASGDDRAAAPFAQALPVFLFAEAIQPIYGRLWELVCFRDSPVSAPIELGRLLNPAQRLMLTKPNHGLRRLPVDESHGRNLGVLLLDVLLIDAYLVDPNGSGLFRMSEGG